MVLLRQEIIAKLLPTKRRNAVILGSSCLCFVQSLEDQAALRRCKLNFPVRDHVIYALVEELLDSALDSILDSTLDSGLDSGFVSLFLSELSLLLCVSNALLEDLCA